MCGQAGHARVGARRTRARRTARPPHEPPRNPYADAHGHTHCCVAREEVAGGREQEEEAQRGGLVAPRGLRLDSKVSQRWRSSPRSEPTR